IPPINLGLNSSGAIVGPIAVPPIHILPISLGLNSSSAIVGPINIQPISINPIGLSLSSNPLVIPITIPQSPFTFGIFPLPPAPGTIGPSAVDLTVGGITVTGTIGGITTPTVNISGIPLGVSVGGVVGDPVNGITLFPGGYTLPGIPLDINVG
ncbi:PPE family protein, partial [Mycobacterium kansasii]